MKFDAQVDLLVEEDIVVAIGRKDGFIDHPHDHADHYQIEILLEGSSIDLARSSSKTITPYQVNAIDPSAAHRTNYQKTDSIFFFASRNLVAQHLRRQGIRNTQPSFNPGQGYDFNFSQSVLKSQVQTMWALHHALKQTPDDALVRGLIKESAYSTLNVVLSQLIPASAAQTRDYHEPLIRRVCDWLQDNYADETVSFDAIAERANLSRFHFARVFRKVTGQSPLGYLQTVRVQRARELAKSKKHLSKLEIALSVGFQSTKQLKYHDRVVGRANRP